jgi:hypothetical protein
MKDKCCGKARFLIPFFVLGAIALFALAVFELWNGVLTDVLGVKMITYWQALGILALAKILFGGFPCRGGRGRFGPPWHRHPMMERWDSLSPEQRDEMREEMRRRFGDWPGSRCGGAPDAGNKPAA